MNSGNRLTVSRFCFTFVLLFLVGVSLPLASRVSASRSDNRGQQSQARSDSKISSQVLTDTEGGKRTSVVILLADQADLSAAYTMADQDARGWYVYNTLTQHAARTQADLKAFLSARGVLFQSFWAANMVVASADRNLIESIASRSDVARIDSNRPVRWIEDPVISKFRQAPNTTNAIEWGVQNVNAPAVWALGFTGQGIVIGNQDTGVRWTHAAIKNQYRGWNGVTADHNFNWHDSIHSGGGSCGANTLVPCDDSGHGTHTAGTSSGFDGGANQIGVAPGARWIGCRNMDQGNGTPATYTECFQFMIAPTDLNGMNPNPAIRPHVLNNSWTCPTSEGCVTRAELEAIVNNAEASGIFVEASAGNSGPSCSTVTDPPAIYSAAFSTGAIDITNALASFSSRGPSTYYSPNLLKPNISAPGVNVRSCTFTNDTSYGNLSGTSMAGPHVVGVVALLWSARPQLARNIALTKSILQSTANPDVSVAGQTCGGIPSTQIPNNSFGYGRVDALAAVNAAPTAALAAISGTIQSPNGSNVAGVVVRLAGAQSATTITDSQGFYRFDNLDVDRFYTVSPSLANYDFSPSSRSFSLIGNRTDAVFTASANMIASANAIDTNEFFVRQQYVDFLNREPDRGGFEYWSSRLNECAGDNNCLRTRRIDVSAAFFGEREFQRTGSFIFHVYKGALGRSIGYQEFTDDRRQIIEGADLEQTKTAYLRLFVSRPEFVRRYQANSSAASFVDAVLATANSSGADLSSIREALIAKYNQGADQLTSRALVIREVGENDSLSRAVYDQGFVLMEYFGYLGRDPDQAGYDFWLDVLHTRDAGNYRGMVCAFLTSREYQQRFSPVITRNNSECGP